MWQILQTLKSLGTEAILLIFIGQSNMDGVGYASELTGSDSIAYYGTIDNCYTLNWDDGVSSASWVQLHNPNSTWHGKANTYNSDRFGPVVAACKDVQDTSGLKIYAIQYSWGATMIDTNIAGKDWNRYSTNEYYDSTLILYNKAVDMMNEQYDNRWLMGGIAWNLGETDSDDADSEAQFEENEYNFIMGFRSNIDSVLFITSGVKDEATINSAKQANAARSNFTYYFSNDDLTFEDGRHYNTAGNIIHGQRFAVIFNNYIDSVINQ